ncbi:G-patch DNA repair protein [Tirmania nivea]|nr:G-patch DNA repair protein [Tirmania nivea]
MSGSSNPPPRMGGLSLYANLLEPSSTTGSTTSIQRAPVVFNKASGDSQDGSASSDAQRKLNAAALRFQPTKRPQVNQTKPKPKISMKPVGTATVTANTTTEAATVAATATMTIEPARPVVKTSLNDWAHTGNSDDDVNGFYASKEKERDRRRKKRRKNKEAEFEPVDWDDIYDPARPNNYEEYRDGEEKIREIDEWRDRLYGKKYGKDGTRSDEGDSEDDYRPLMNRQFAPPPPGPPVEVPDDATGEDAYARRVRLSQMGTLQPPLPQSDTPQPPPPGPPSVSPTIETAPGPTISRAPVLYQQPPSQPSPTTMVAAEGEEMERSEGSAHPEDEPRSLRPGQQGFAHRLLAKYGWTKGTGLGAEGSGIIKPLHVVASKKKDEAGRGKIIDQNKKHRVGDEGKFGKMTEVVVLGGMLRGIDKEEIASGELRQEIGEECGEKYGRVERVYIHDRGVDEEDGEGPKVFVQFTSQLSALRAVNALEGRHFNGNAIEAKFFDKDKFERGQYQ